ncbi:MAG TPA: hypothetical protein PKA32_02580 [Candidatus Gracilibacteria bacterium]|nr:hypothetical protein [Candidatus Gracilibacteria bacterium]
MEAPDKNQKRMEVLIPAYEALEYSEQRIAGIFMNWFVSCSNKRELLDLCESAARSRFDRISWLRIMRELNRLNPGGPDVIGTIKKMAKMDENIFLDITAKLEQIVALKAEKLSKETTHKVRIIVSDDVKNALK